MTTENVAILFSDIMGSTELSQRLPQDAADELRRGHFSILRQAVTEAGGTEVKNLGDGIMVVFGSASAALACAVVMQQGVELDNRGSEEEVGLRVGLSGGEVSREDDDYFGDPVVEAARLCAKCESGQVLASEWLRLTAGRRSRHEFRPLGEMALKGLPDPVETVEVLWEPLGGAETAVVPLPGRLAVRPAVGLVGRETEMAAITEATKRVAGGEGRGILLVSGEAGLGKTTLVAEAARSAFDAGVCVLFGHCEEDLATPYQLFAEALGHYVTHAPEQQLLDHVEAHGSELSRLVPALNNRIPDLPPSKATDSDTERFLLFAAVVELLAALSQHQPVILVLDDLQWADKGSLWLFRHLASADPTMRVMIVGTYRDSELSNANALVDVLAALRRLEGVSRIDLVGLDDAGVVALMEAGAGHPLDDGGVALAHAIYRETDGNPFFVSEVLRNLVETGAIGQDAEGYWVAEHSLDNAALPDSVREVIGSRVLRLGKEAGRVLSVASVIGRDFDLDLLAGATKTSDDDLLDILDAAAAVALVREVADSGRYSFAHALIQHTLYQNLGHNRRARAHRQVAEALEDLCGDRPGPRVGELARHWIAATQPIDLAKAISYSRQAGDAALAALAPADALRYYAQALDLYAQATDTDPLVGIDLSVGLGTAQRQIGDPAYRDTLLGAAHRAADLGDTQRLVAAALTNNRGWVSNAGATDAEKVEVLELALDRVSADDPDRALLLVTLRQELQFGGTLERLEALANEAVVVARNSGDDATVVRVFNSVSFSAPISQALAWSADALVRAQRIGDPVLLFLVADGRLNATSRVGDIDEIDRCLEIMGSTVEKLGHPTLNWRLMHVRATRAQIAGDPDRAEELATEALQIGTDGGEPDAALIFGSQMAIVNYERGTMGELVPFIKEAAAENPGLPVLVAALAMAYAEGDQTDHARQLLEEFAATGFYLPMTNSTWLTGMVTYGGAAIECRDLKFALPLFDRLAPWADEWSATGGPTVEGPVSHTLGGLATLLGRYDEADGYFAHSAASSERANAKFFAARTYLLWGRMFAERVGPGDVEKAHDLLTKAHTTAVANGYGNVEHRAVTALRDLD